MLFFCRVNLSESISMPPVTLLVPISKRIYWKNREPFDRLVTNVPSIFSISCWPALLQNKEVSWYSSQKFSYFSANHLHRNTSLVIKNREETKTKTLYLTYRGDSSEMSIFEDDLRRKKLNCFAFPSCE